MGKIENYSIEKLRKEIKTNGWLASIFVGVIAYFSFTILYDLIQGNDFNRTILYALLAIFGGSLSMFLQRKKMIKELKNREGKEGV